MGLRYLTSRWRRQQAAIEPTHIYFSALRLPAPRALKSYDQNPVPVQLNSHATQAITMRVARAKTIKSWSNVVELACSTSFALSRRAARRRGLLVLRSVMARKCSVSDKRNPAIVGVNLNGRRLVGAND